MNKDFTPAFVPDENTELKIDLDVYNAMLVAIQGRPEKIGLRFEHSIWINNKVPENILQENRETLSIEREHNNEHNERSTELT